MKYPPTYSDMVMECIHLLDGSMMPTTKITMNKIIVYRIGDSGLIQKRQIQMK